MGWDGKDGKEGRSGRVKNAGVAEWVRGLLMPAGCQRWLAGWLSVRCCLGCPAFKARGRGRGRGGCGVWDAPWCFVCCEPMRVCVCADALRVLVFFFFFFANVSVRLCAPILGICSLLRCVVPVCQCCQCSACRRRRGDARRFGRPRLHVHLPCSSTAPLPRALPRLFVGSLGCDGAALPRRLSSASVSLHHGARAEGWVEGPSCFGSEMGSGQPGKRGNEAHSEILGASGLGDRWDAPCEVEMARRSMC